MTLRYPTHAGPDHSWYEHRRAARTPGTNWSGGHRSAAFVLIRVHALEIETPKDFARDPRWRIDFGNYSPEYRSHSLMEYGNRIGVFRLLDLFQPLGWKVAAAVNGLVAHENPWLIRELDRCGVEIVASGWSASRMLTSAVSSEVETELIRRSRDAIAEATGRVPCTYSSQDYGYSMNTASILSSLGFSTAIDWPNDEVPFLFGEDRQLLMIPPAAELDDAQMVVGRRLQSPRWCGHLAEALSYWKDHGLSGSVLALPLHAWISGAPHRFTNLSKIITAFDAQSFWQATPREIESAWRVQREGNGAGCS